MTSTSDLARTAQQLLASQNQGTLATQSIKHPGFPFCSLMPYSLSESDMPLLLISSMATHTRNLKANPNASLLVAAPSHAPMTKGRATLIGIVEKIPEPDVHSARQVYLADHPESERWIDFGDFGFYQLRVIDTYVVAGFGTMGWLGKP